jgi:hypothetical protein
MPLTIKSVSSAPSNIHSERLLSTPTSYETLNDRPFVPENDDHTSLNMKKKRRHQHSHDSSSTVAVSSTSRPTRQQAKRPGAGPRQRSRRPRRSTSMPTVQPKFAHGSIETIESRKTTSQQPRRWTLESKAGSTQGIATVVPVNDKLPRLDPSLEGLIDSMDSPAMITLRRATTVGSRNRSATTLTSFPTPKFSRNSSSLLAMLINTITGHDEAPAQQNARLLPSITILAKSRRPLAAPKGKSARPSISASAPPVHTEVTAAAPATAVGNSTAQYNGVRRCSTRYTSGSAVFEVIWDENWDTSSNSSGNPPTPHGHGSILQARDLSGSETAERRLSKTLSSSRRQSEESQEPSRRPSLLPILDVFESDLWNNADFTRLFREPRIGRLSYSKPTKRLVSSPASIKGLDRESHAKTHERQRQSSAVEFFPPLRPCSSATSAHQNQICPRQLEAPNQETSVVVSASVGRRGSLVGISGHARRQSAAVEELKVSIRNASRGKRACEYRNRGKRPMDEERAPLLVDG